MDNPPAFPSVCLNDPGHPQSVPGMTLRDWYASRAPEPPANWWGGGAKDCAGYALWGFQYAEAMLAEREARLAARGMA